jgi:TRAP-type C4-dicarboxylate transport system substrate-binding protein
MASTKKVGALPANLQKIVREEAKAAQGLWRDQTAQQLRDDVDALRKNGVTVNEHVQIAPFRRAVTPVYAAYQGKFGDLVDRITKAG